MVLLKKLLLHDGKNFIKGRRNLRLLNEREILDRKKEGSESLKL